MTGSQQAGVLPLYPLSKWPFWCVKHPPPRSLGLALRRVLGHAVRDLRDHIQPNDLQLLSDGGKRSIGFAAGLCQELLLKDTGPLVGWAPIDDVSTLRPVIERELEVVLGEDYTEY